MTERVHRQAIRVIGVGNPWRGDDAVGLLAARRLRDQLDLSVEVMEAEGDGLALLDLMEGADHVLFIDAVMGGGRPGTCVRLDASTECRWGPVVPSSTHAMGIAEAIELARALERLPKQVVVYGIEIESVESGVPLSPAVCDGLDVVIEMVMKDIERTACTNCI